MILKRTFEECVSLFSYQRSVLHCRLSQTALLLYHVVSCLSRTFFNFFEVVFVSLLQQLWYLITSNRLLSRTFSFLFLQLFVRRNSFMLSRVFSDVKNFFSFLFINAEGGIWTLARRKPSIPLAGAPLQPLGYFSICLIRRSVFSFVTERVGFEPTRPFGQTVFKTASLWPLRYLSIIPNHCRLAILSLFTVLALNT